MTLAERGLHLVASDMTLAEARKIVAGRLAFGDPRHIEAVALIERDRRFLNSPASMFPVKNVLRETWSEDDFEEAEEEHEWANRRL